LLITDGAFLDNGAFHPIESWDAEAVMKLFRERLLARLIERHAISEDLARRLLSWHHPGFSAHVGGAIPIEDRKAIEDVACYLVRAPLSLKKLVYLDGQKAVLYRLWGWATSARTSSRSHSPQSSCFFFSQDGQKRRPRQEKATRTLRRQEPHHRYHLLRRAEAEVVEDVLVLRLARCSGGIASPLFNAIASGCGFEVSGRQSARVSPDELRLLRLGGGGPLQRDGVNALRS
jgi:hypothetical protein